MIGIHMIFLSNAYQQFKNELVQIERIRKKRKLVKTAEKTPEALSSPKEMKIS